MTRQPELFEGADYGAPQGVSLARARNLVDRVCRMMEPDEEYDGWYADDMARRLASQARALGAHSIARALDWWLMPEAINKYGYESADILVAATARRWLARLEAERLGGLR